MTAHHLPITLPAVIGAVAKAFGVSRDDLMSRNREHSVRTARCALVALAVEMTTMSQAEIARAIKRDPSSISNALDAAAHRARTVPIFKRRLDHARTMLTAVSVEYVEQLEATGKKVREGGVYAIKLDGSVCVRWWSDPTCGCVMRAEERREWSASERPSAVAVLRALRRLLRAEGDASKPTLVWSRRSAYPSPDASDVAG